MSDLKTALHVQHPIQQTEVLGKFPDLPGYRKLQEMQRVMMRNDGKLVWQKLPLDGALFKFTIALSAVGLLYMSQLFYKMAFNKAKK